MNCANKFIAAVVMAFAFATLSVADSIDYGKVNPPWKPGKYYSVVSRYDMELKSIVMHVKKFRKAYEGWIWHHDEKLKDHYYSNPFTGTYSCALNYQTFAAHFANKNNGSVFRRYASAEVRFKPQDRYGKTIIRDADPWWFQRWLGLDSKEVSNQKIANMMQDADFMFREVFMTDGQHLDGESWYFLGWNQLEAFKADLRYRMDVFKKGVHAVPQSFLENITPKDRARIQQCAFGTDPASGWEKKSCHDLGYCVAQAEAKMMAYAIYGQEKTRSVGDVWEIDSEALESFFPLQEKGRKPFSFDRGALILTVESDNNGIVKIKSLPRGCVDGCNKSTDLRITPRTEDNEHRPKFKMDMWNEQDNYARFTIDSFNEVCTKAELRATLKEYNGAVPKVDQLSLNNDDPDYEMRVDISDGEVILHCVMTTTVEDKQ